MGLNIILVVIFLNSVCRHGIDAQAPVLSANASSVTKGNSLNIVCTLSAETSSVTWYRIVKGGTTEQAIITVGLSGGSCISVPSTPPDGLVVTCGTLEYGCTIPSLSTSEDGDVWRCAVPLLGVNTYSNSLRINVTISPLITDIRSVEVARDNTATIVCDIAGTFAYPRWDDGTNTIYVAEGTSIFNPSTTDSRWARSSDTKNLIISSIEDSDAGTYRCSITTPTIDSYTARLKVIEHSVSPLITDIRSVEVARGDTATIVCDIAGTFAYPRWDDGINTIYVAEGTSIFNPSTTDSRWARSGDTKNLIISSIEDSDAGTYRCSITTPTIDSYTARLKVIEHSVSPLITDIRSVEVARGDTATIVCDIAGTFAYPRWDDGINTIYVAEGTSIFNPSTTDSRWARSGDTKNLIISSIEDSDAGTYRCSITTPAIDSYTARLKVIEHSVSPLITDIRSVEVARGDTATIVCDIAGTFAYPRWDDGTNTIYVAEGTSIFNPSTTDSRWARSSDTKNLIISSIEDSDAGTYRCSITTPTIDSYTARLKVIEHSVSPLITDIRSVEVARGDTATIVCDIAGTFAYPRWDDGTNTIYVAEGTSIFNPSTTDSRWARSSDTKNLIISSIEDSDAGTYRCSITTPTIDSYTARLKVIEHSVSPLITDIRSVEVARGDTATIVCDIAGTFVNPMWDDGTNTIYVAEGTSIFNPSTTDSRWARSSDTKNLIISSIEDSDAGTYRCSIITPIIDRYTARLNVIEQTVGITSAVITSPIVNPVSVIVNTTSTFLCETSPGNTISTVAWYKDNTNQANANDTKITSGTNTSSKPEGNLYVTYGTLNLQVQRGDQDVGVYCRARNRDQWFTSGTKKINVLYGPDRPECTSNNVNISPTLRVVVGSTFSISCTADSNPLPNIYQLSGQGGNNLQLSFIDIARSQAGSYIIEARNNMSASGSGSPVTGRNSTSFTIDVLYGAANLQLLLNNVSNASVEIEEHSTNNLQCSLESNPASHMFIVKDGKTILERPGAQQGNPQELL
ncbi:titin-like [Mya arenaria]|uniref:titin-like n=1 Tax=Mya arenaria TaxID=6604 RepID=UPI0022E5F374|nr:titin-like [Mya arenaria]